MDQEEPEIQTSQMVCPNCAGRNPASVSFCDHCGQRTRPENGGCPSCLTVLPPDAQFCPECGAPAGMPVELYAIVLDGREYEVDAELIQWQQDAEAETMASLLKEKQPSI